MFRPSTVIRELVLSLAKVMLEHWVKLCPYSLCGGVAACLGLARVLCAVQNESELGGALFFVAFVGE
jgi:ABC-type transporter Mla maintaining outer membrane lipid asymmetry ATPase subunit MlaF